MGDLGDSELSSQLTGLDVLLVEDNDINQELAIDLLEEFGVNVSVAVNGEEALDWLAKKDFDGVLMDCQMPELDGYNTTRMIRSDSRLEHYQDIPIVALTANAMSGDKEKCLDAGMNDYLSKPIDPDAMSGKLRYWLRNS